MSKYPGARGPGPSHGASSTSPRQPLEREAKLRVNTAARCLPIRAEAGRHYGIVTANAPAVLDALPWGFHNANSGQCDPSYEAIAIFCNEVTGKPAMAAPFPRSGGGRREAPNYKM